MTQAAEQFLVVAASCRSLVRSIRLAGYQCAGIDLFADADTVRYCPVHQAGTLDAAIDQAAQFTDDHLIVTGSGVENRFLDRSDAFGNKRICGSTAEAVAKVRDPFFVFERIQEFGFPALEVRAELPRRGHWVRKSIRSGGGRGVKLFPDDGPRRSPRVVDGFYFQQFLPGPVFGASLVSDGQSTHLMGTCRQFFCRHGGDEFVYCGSSGPVHLPDNLIISLECLGLFISRACGLRGWFGIDFVLRRGYPMLLEVNPRYTASMEILERVWQQSLFPRHLAGVQSAIQWQGDLDRPPFRLAKRYVYWQEPLPVIADSQFYERLMVLCEGDAEFVTDVPRAGTVIKSGLPVCTVWASHEQEDAAQAKAFQMELDILAMLKQKTAVDVPAAVR